MTDDELQAMASIDAMIFAEIDIRLSQRVGPANARIDPRPNFIANSEHATLMSCIGKNIRPACLMGTELGMIMGMGRCES